ncbi:hypothetical protein GCM10027168_12790 [Streptomyces capparidis]
MVAVLVAGAAVLSACGSSDAAGPSAKAKGGRQDGGAASGEDVHVTYQVSSSGAGGTVDITFTDDSAAGHQTQQTPVGSPWMMTVTVPAGSTVTLTATAVPSPGDPGDPLSGALPPRLDCSIIMPGQKEGTGAGDGVCNAVLMPR